MNSVTKIAPEYINQSRLSIYPFKDTSTLIDLQGLVLPIDWLQDLYITGINCGSYIFIKQIDFVNKTIIFTDNLGIEVGRVKNWTQDCTIYEYFDIYDFKRPVGKVVLSDITSDNIYNFDITGTQISPACYTVLNQKGIRGIVINNKVITGNIHFKGAVSEIGTRQGVVVYSYDNILNFQAIGDPDDRHTPDSVCVETPPSINQICVTTLEGSPLALAVETSLSGIEVVETVSSTISSITITKGAIRDINKYLNYMVDLSYTELENTVVLNEPVRIIQIIDQGDTIKLVVEYLPESMQSIVRPDRQVYADIIIPNILHIWHRHCSEGVIVPTIIDDICIKESGPRFKWTRQLTDPCEDDNEDPCEPMPDILGISEICLYPINGKFWIVGGDERAIIAITQKETNVTIVVKDGAGIDTITDIRGAITVKTVGASIE